MVGFFKLICKESGKIKTVFELDVKGDMELDYINSLKKNCYVKQINYTEYEWLVIEQREKCFMLDAHH